MTRRTVSAQVLAFGKGRRKAQPFSTIVCLRTSMTLRSIRTTAPTDLPSCVFNMDTKRQQGLRANPSSAPCPGPPTDKFLYEKRGLELLAYLQYSISAKLPASRFLRDVVAHIKTCNESYKVQIDYIDLKLKQYFDYWRHPSEPLSVYKKVYQLGLKALPRMRRETMSWVESRAEDLKIFYEPQGRTRVLRSVSRTPAHQDAPTPTKMSATGRSGKKLRKRRQRQSRKATKSPLIPKITRDVSNMKCKNPSACLTREQSLSRSGQAEPSTPQPSRERAAPMEIMDSEGHCSFLEETIESPSTVIEALLTPISTERRNGRPVIAGNPVKLGTKSGRLSPTQYSEPADLTTQARLHMEFQRSQDRNEIDYWRQRFLQEQANSKGLKNFVTILSVKLNKAGDVDDDDSELKLLRELDELREDLATCRAAGLCYQNDDSQDAMAANASEVAADMAIIQGKIREFLWEYDVGFDIEMLGTTKDDDFINLLQGCLGLARDKELLHCGNILQGVNLGQLLCSLVSVAIIRWVFEDDIGFLLARGCLVCSSYHALIAAQSKFHIVSGNTKLT